MIKNRTVEIAFLMVANSLALLFGCRAMPTGLAIAAARDGIRLAEVREAEKNLLGHDIADAERRFGRPQNCYRDELSGDDLVFYPMFSLPSMDQFHVVRTTEAGEIVAVSGWLKNSDGLEDLLKLLVTRRRVVGKSLDEARKRARLKDPVLILACAETPEKLYIFDVTNFTHILPRVLQLAVDKNGICVRADYFGAISRQTALPAEDDSKAQRHDPIGY